VRPLRVRKKKRRHGRSRILRDWWIPALLVAVAAAILGVRYLSHLKPMGQVAGYISNSEILTQEYLQYEGKPLPSLAAEQQFQEASVLAGKGDYRGAVQMLESLARHYAVPVIFHDLGVLYAQVDDRDRALQAFREVLARDANYAPTQLSLNSLRGFGPHAADPPIAESEPNSTYLTANLISLGATVVGEISTPDDVDCFRFIAPQSPRDVLQIEIKSQSVSLAPKITVYDASGHPTGETAESAGPGAGVSLLLSPPPNSTNYVEVAGTHGTSGPYAILVTATHAFDRFEPDDDIASAHAIAVGREIDANIMTAEDTDFYSFVADHTGKMVVTVEGQAGSLTPGVAVFGPTRQPIAYVVTGAEKDRKLSRSFDVEEHQTYYVQVWGQTKSSGPYTLLIQ